jgi:hypothetical protein
LVEHAFIGGDSDFLNSDSKLQSLGEADANAIVSYYGLTLKPEYETVSSEISSQTNDVSSEVSSEPESSTTDVSSQIETDGDAVTSEDNEDTEVKAVEDIINNLPENPTENDANQIKAARTAFIALGENRQKLISAELYQKLCNSVTVYENLMHPVRIVPKSGSEISVDRVNGKLLNVETAAQSSGKITVFSVMLELELYIDPDAPEEYKDETALDYRAIGPDGNQLNYDDVIPNNSVISIVCGETVLDTLTVSITQ